MSENTVNLEKRRFLQVSALLGGALLVGINLDVWASSQNDQPLNGGASEKRGGGYQPTIWLKIFPDNTLLVTVPSVEMGQGVATALPMLLAEEMEADWENVKFELAEANKQFNNPLSGRQQTGGSASIKGYWKALREAGSSIKQLFIIAAAKQWQVSSQECRAELSKVIHVNSDRQISFAELIPVASQLKMPSPGPLKKPEEFNIIGKPQRRLDSLQKVNGSAIFGQDVQLPDMLVAVIQRAPFLARLKHYNADKALKIRDVIDVVVIDSGVAVVAKHFWAANQAKALLEIEWDETLSQKLNSEDIRLLFKDKVSNAVPVDSQGDMEYALDNAFKTINAVYEVPFLAHACMEPMNCTAHVQVNRCDIWAPTQGPGPAKKLAVKLTKLDQENVFVHPTFIGGGFGRRSEKDFVKEAVQLSQKMQKPVKVMWSREDDIQHDYYRPASYNEMRGGIDEKGKPYFWQHKLASPSILNRIVPFVTFTGLDPTSTEGASHLPYEIEHQEVTYAIIKDTVPVGFWRSVGNSMNGFVRESFLDELASLGKQDPYQLRRELLKKHPRLLGVLDLVAEKAAWTKPLGKGKYRGIAVVESFESYVAQVAEIHLDKNEFRVEKIYCAVDCGLVVNPLTVEAQIQGAIIFGLTAALKGNITVAKGRVEQSNFHDYPLLRFDETPEIEVHLVKSAESPTGIGEPGVPPVAPAVANAIFSATGNPVRQLPINTDLIKSQVS